MTFNINNGWTASRTEDGGVHIVGHDGEGVAVVELMMDDSSWASVVAAVSARGETGETFGEALRFHNEERS